MQANIVDIEKTFIRTYIMENKLSFKPQEIIL